MGLVIVEKTSLASLSVEAGVVPVDTGLVEGSRGTIVVRVVADALVVEVDRCDECVHASETVAGDAEDEAGTVVGVSGDLEIVGSILGLEVTLKSKLIHCAPLACRSDTTSQAGPVCDGGAEVLLESPVSSEDEEDLVHLGDDGREAGAA